MPTSNTRASDSIKGLRAAGRGRGRKRERLRDQLAGAAVGAQVAAAAGGRDTQDGAVAGGADVSYRRYQYAKIIMSLFFTRMGPWTLSARRP